MSPSGPEFPLATCSAVADTVILISTMYASFLAFRSFADDDPPDKALSLFYHG